jgi:O-antigen/teichoic acid export membrane protein
MNARLSSVLKSKSTLLTFAMCVSQAIYLIITLLQVRFLGLDGFGKISILVSLSAVMALIFRAGIVTSISIMIAEAKEKKVEEIYFITLVIALLSTLTIGMIALLLVPSVGENFGVQISREYNFIYLLLGYFLLAEYAENVMKGNARIYLLSAYLVLNSSFIFLGTATLIFFNFEWQYFFLMRCIIQLILALLVLMYFGKKFRVNTAILFELVIMLKKVGLPLWFSHLADGLVGRVNEFVLAAFFSPEVSGTYKLITSLNAPCRIIMVGISKTRFAAYALLEAIPKKDMRISNRVSLIILSMPIFSMIIVNLVTDYKISEVFLALILAAFASSIVSGYQLQNTFFEVKKQGGVLFKAGLFMGVTHSISIMLLAPNFAFLGAILADLIAACIYYVLIKINYKRIYRYDSKN